MIFLENKQNIRTSELFPIKNLGGPSPGTLLYPGFPFSSKSFRSRPGSRQKALLRKSGVGVRVKMGSSKYSLESCYMSAIRVEGRGAQLTVKICACVRAHNQLPACARRPTLPHAADWMVECSISCDSHATQSEAR